MIVRRSLGVNLCNSTGVLECKSCSGFLDPKGDHECPKDGAWVKAHNTIRDVYYETAREGLVECRREQSISFKPECAECHQTLSPDEKENGHSCSKRPARKRKETGTTFTKDDTRIITPSYTADLVFEQGIPGLSVKRTLVDFTIKHEFMDTYRAKEAQKLGSAAHLGEKEKENDYKDRAHKIGHAFVAVAFNSLGYTRPNGEDLAYYLIDQRAKHKGMTFQESASLFWHKLSMSIHRAHALNILRRFRDYSIDQTVPHS